MKHFNKTDTLLHFHHMTNYKAFNGSLHEKLNISYQIYGKELHTAPIVVVNHALTGNSDILSDKNGWWKDLVGKNKLIDSQKFTIIIFNILGNGFDGSLITNYKDFIIKDVAFIYIKALENLGIQNLHSVIGGSIGGGIAWEMAILKPHFITYLIPIASDWKATDWIIGHNAIQENILLHSKFPLQDARKMAMLFYRTPQSYTNKFNRSKTLDGLYNVNSWLNHHGEKLEKRFKLKAYLMMNHLLTTIDITRSKNNFEDAIKPVTSIIIQIAINTDLFFSKTENILTKEKLDAIGKNNQYHEIISDEGHDAFLIEQQQITQFLTPIYK